MGSLEVVRVWLNDKREGDGAGERKRIREQNENGKMSTGKHPSKQGQTYSFLVQFGAFSILHAVFIVHHGTR